LSESGEPSVAIRMRLYIARSPQSDGTSLG
jgi:hypothetical protein